jgi:hypothetical protein
MERHRFALRVRVNLNTHGILINLSEGGALLRLPRCYTAPSQITLSIESRAETVHLPAKIVRSTPLQLHMESARIMRMEHQIAVQFLDVGDETVGRVRQIMQSQTQDV